MLAVGFETKVQIWPCHRSWISNQCKFVADFIQGAFTGDLQRATPSQALARSSFAVAMASPLYQHPYMTTHDTSLDYLDAHAKSPLIP